MFKNAETGPGCAKYIVGTVFWQGSICFCYDHNGAKSVESCKNLGSSISSLHPNSIDRLRSAYEKLLSQCAGSRPFDFLRLADYWNWCYHTIPTETIDDPELNKWIFMKNNGHNFTPWKLFSIWKIRNGRSCLLSCCCHLFL